MKAAFIIQTRDALDVERMAHDYNPFQNGDALENSRYFAYEAGKLIAASDPPAPVTPLAEFVHDGFRALVLNPHFTCVAAKSAFNKANYRFAMYENDLRAGDGRAGARSLQFSARAGHAAAERLFHVRGEFRRADHRPRGGFRAAAVAAAAGAARTGRPFSCLGSSRQ